MTYPRPLIRIRFGGALPGPEEWQCGLSFTDTAPAGNLSSIRGAFETFSIDDVADDIAQLFQPGGPQWGSGVTLTYVEAALIDTNGHYDTVTAVNPRQHEYSPIVDPPNFTTEDNQRALAVTLYSGSNLGKGNYGRFYLPPLAAPPDPATGQISVTDATTVLTTVVTMLEAVKGEVDTLPTDMHLVIPTEVAPAHKVVTQVKVGRVYDTQRRRRRSVPEDYVVDASVNL